jgi:hypothetical protein
VRKELKQALLYSGRKLTTRTIELQTDTPDFTVGAIYLARGKNNSWGLGPLFYSHTEDTYYLETSHNGDMYVEDIAELFVIEMEEYDEDEDRSVEQEGH